MAAGVAAPDRQFGIAVGRECDVAQARVFRFDPAQPGGEPERAANAGLAVDADFTAHHLGQPPRDDQPKAGAAVFACRRVVGLDEGGEKA